MAQHKSAIKRIGLSKKQNLRNRTYKSSYKTAIKRVLESASKEIAEKEFINAVSLLDKLVSKGIIHRNNAGRKKAQLARFVNSLA